MDPTRERRFAIVAYMGFTRFSFFVRFAGGRGVSRTQHNCMVTRVTMNR